MLFSTLNTAAEPALWLEPSLSLLLCHFCSRAKWHPAQGTICPHPGAGTGQAQTDPGLCCPRRRYLDIPFGRCPPFPPHCWEAERHQPSSWTLPGQAAGRARARVLFFLPHAPSAIGSQPLPKGISRSTDPTQKRKPNFRFDGIQEVQHCTCMPQPARALRSLQGPELPAIPTSKATILKQSKIKVKNVHPQKTQKVHIHKWTQESQNNDKSQFFELPYNEAMVFTMLFSSLCIQYRESFPNI